MRMKTFPLLALLALVGCCRLFAEPSDYTAIKANAESLFAEGSFAKAHEVYQTVQKMELPAGEKRWVDFRLADTLWRSAAATATADDTQLENARKQFEVLIRDLPRVEDHDRVWVEVQESLGDYFWTRRNSQNWGEAWPHYQAALDWWAGAAQLELARTRYLKIIWDITDRPSWQGGGYYYWNYGGQLPLEILENTLKIAQTPNDQAHAHYLLAMALRNQGGDWDQRERVPEEFAGAIKIGKATAWYDDALYNYAEWMLSNGRVIPLKDGSWTQEPDYKKALELFRRLVKEFQKGETLYYEPAENQIKSITDPTVSVSVANIFLPDSEIQYSLNWRNVKRIELALYAVELTRDVQLSGADEQRENWLQSINLASRKKMKAWSRDTKDQGDYKPGAETIHLDGKLPVGAYVLEARGEGKTARELVLVTDASVVLKTSGKQALVYMCNALAGSPLAEADVKLWERYYEKDQWHWRESSKKTNPDGIAVFDLMRSSNQEQIFAAASLKDRQAFGTDNNYSYSNGRNQEDWRIYAFTDRPAYRPTETVQWKFIARKKSDGAAYVTPSDQVVEFQITDPRGAKVKADKVKLNAFGSAWGSLELKENMPLGKYRVTFWTEGKKRQIGNATPTLFRLEEYKLPEFKVSVQTSEENGRKKTFRLGEKVEVKVQADYYFGGAVANASVELIVHQSPYYHSWHRPHDYPWFYEEVSPEYQRGRSYGGGDQIIKRETVKTDATGNASLTFDTPRTSGQDYEYHIEARVTDASRREITGSGEVRVTGQRYYVYPEAAHNLYRPQDKVSVEFKALDANEQPVATEGTVKVTREYWYEVWLDPNGREVKGGELKNFRSRSMIFPPPPARTNDRPWQLKFRGYEHDEILTRTLKTDTNGVAELNFTPEREGYYRLAWTSEDHGKTNARPAPPIQAETTVWVATGATTELGYQHGGMEIIVDKDTFRVGQTAPIMLSVPTNDRYVLFSVEGEDLYSYQLIHVTGTVKLVELPIEEKHVPNIFLSAALVSDRQLFVDTKQIVVPPAKNFLSINVQSNKAQYQPRETGTFTITARDDQQQPVSAEIAFGLVDESVYYIQSDYAGDPRQFYFGEKRAQQIRTESTFNQKSYAQLVEAETNQFIDIRDLELLRRRGFNSNGAWRDRSGGDLDELSEGLNRNGSSRISGLLADSMLGLAKDKGEGFQTGATYRSIQTYSAMPANAPMGGAVRLKANSAEIRNAADFAWKKPGEAQAEPPAVQVRSDFRSSIFWQPDIITDKEGKATVKVTYPDSLTSWKATARAVTEVNQFGIASTNIHTKQPLIVRLEAPRFFVVGDKVTISAVINNNTDQAMAVSYWLNADGLDCPECLVERRSALSVNVPANAEKRVDWHVEAKVAGLAKLKVTARGDKYSDAMEKSYTVYEHGIEKFISKSGKVRGDNITVKLKLPKERKVESTTLTVQITPSMAVTMLDALPYLIDYPYGCTEQTMSRFLPAAITAKTLRDLGLKPEESMGRLFGGIEATNAVATHPKGKRDLHELDAITRQSLERLYDFQHGDGGWGWWKPGESDHFMTAYVVWGLTLAQEAGVTVKGGVARRGADYLDKTLVEEELNYDEQAWMLHALSVQHAFSKSGKVSPFQVKAFANLWTNREKLNAYTRALLALSAHNYGYHEQAKTLIANLENGVKIDNSPDISVLISNTPSTNNSLPSTTLATAHWGEDGVYWRWSEGGVEATAFALRALLAIDPQNKLIEPVSNWLIKNRRGAQWSNTRDTAITVLAMNDYLRVSGELAPDLEYELLVNGQAIATKHVSGAEVFNAPSKFTIDPKLIREGENDIRIVRRSGAGPIYFAANATYFSLEEPITPAGNEIFVRRQYYKLAGRPTLLKGYVYDREPLNDGGAVKSGDRVETVLTIETKNNYEYLLFEDLKPAGLEAATVRSGESLYAYELKSGSVDRKFSPNTNNVTPSAPKPANKIFPNGRRRVLSNSSASGILPRPIPVMDEDHTGRTRWVYQELRDRKVALFIDKLPQGVWEIKYDFRAEVPGQFHALPVVGHAMYVPEIRCNGAEVRMTVEEGKP